MRKLYLFQIFVVLLASFSRLVLAETPATPKSQPETGLEGVILVSPIHGGPQRQGEPDSKPLPNTDFIVEKENSIVASFRTDDQGRFRIMLPSGHYTVSKKDTTARIGGYGPFEVDVAAGQIKRVEWNCDSGMR